MHKVMLFNGYDYDGTNHSIFKEFAKYDFHTFNHNVPFDVWHISETIFAVAKFYVRFGSNQGIGRQFWSNATATVVNYYTYHILTQ